MSIRIKCYTSTESLLSKFCEFNTHWHSRPIWRFIHKSQVSTLLSSAMHSGDAVIPCRHKNRLRLVSESKKTFFSLKTMQVSHNDFVHNLVEFSSWSQWVSSKPSLHFHQRIFIFPQKLKYSFCQTHKLNFDYLLNISHFFIFNKNWWDVPEKNIFRYYFFSLNS